MTIVDPNCNALPDALRLGSLELIAFAEFFFSSVDCGGQAEFDSPWLRNFLVVRNGFLFELGAAVLFWGLQVADVPPVLDDIC